MALPLYEMMINADPASELEVTAIALVDQPAIDKNWFAFKDMPHPMAFTTVNEDERLLIGPAMIPDLKIFRTDPTLGEYNVVFSKQTVQQIAEKFYAKNFQGNANIMHDAGQPVPGLNYFMSWFKDSSKGMVGIDGEYPDGTWFVGARVKDDATWAKVKSGQIKGFSVEGVFQYAELKSTEEQMLEKIKEILNGISE